MDYTGYYNKLDEEYKAKVLKYFPINARTLRHLVIWELYYGERFPTTSPKIKRSQEEIAKTLMTQQPNISSVLKRLSVLAHKKRKIIA